MKRLSILILVLCAAPAFAQSDSGELRLRVTDPAGLGIRSRVALDSQANDYSEKFVADDAGKVVAKHLPFGIYRLEVEHPGFVTSSSIVEIRSAIPVERRVVLSLAAVSSSVTVNDSDTLVDPHDTGTVNRIGDSELQDRPTSIPGRSVADLVNSEPGWLYEGNAVLHPRGSEYQTQFVVDGIPLTDNRSPSFGPEIEADDVESVSVYTADIPAEYGRKMGGVVEIVTEKDTREGVHGKAVFGGGSFDTADGYVDTQYAWGANTVGFSAGGARTDRYLNPPVLQNFTNDGTTGNFAVHYERDFGSNDRLGLAVRHELARFEVPNEQLQEAAGQRQDRGIFETMGILSYEHIFSPDLLADFRLMARDDSDLLWSNPLATPIIASENRGFRETYLKGTVSGHHSRHEWKAGFEADITHIHEGFNDVITDPTQFDPGTPATFQFLGSGRDLEQSAFVQDLIRLGSWTVSAGLRWDHYQLLVNQNAASPRLGVARYFQAADLVLHASYDRVFQTPAFENILLSSSPQVVALNPNVLRLPVEPSRGNYYEVGLTKGFFGQFKLDVNYFQRRVKNYADDDQLLNTAVSFPIAFAKANIYGAEGKIEIPHWGRVSGYVSYSYIVGEAYFPVAGGLLLGQDAINATTQLSGRSWDSQDQRNTVRARVRYQLTKKAWVAAGGEYGSGLPVDFDGTQAEALAEYGQAIVNRVNFDRGRVRPSLSVDLSAGYELWKKEDLSVRVQADVENLNNRINVIDFAGLFSGNAVGPPRSYAMRLAANF